MSSGSRRRSVSLGSIFRSQRPFLAQLPFAAIPIVLLICAQFLTTPVERPFLVYDASLANELRESNTIPDWAALLPPWLGLLLTVVVVECVCGRRLHAGPTVGLALALHYALDAALAAVTALAVQESTKDFVGRYRPDWLERCKPDLGDAGVGNGTQTLTGVELYHEEYHCTATGKEVEDGRKSFPSGHAGTSAAVCMYAAVYLLYVTTLRESGQHGSYGGGTQGKTEGNGRGGGLRAPTAATAATAMRRNSLRGQLLRSAGFYWGLVFLAYSWAVGVSRYTDNRHHLEDVIAGWLVGLVTGTLFSARACGNAWRISEYLAATPGSDGSGNGTARGPFEDAETSDVESGVGHGIEAGIDGVEGGRKGQSWLGTAICMILKSPQQDA